MNTIDTLEAALAALKPNIIAHLDVYRVGKPDESSVLPSALWTSPDELRALAFVITEVQRLDSILDESSSEALERGELQD